MMMESFTGMMLLLMTRAVRAACLLSLLIGLLFLFVRAPHPWGWNGFDHYHELALALASGQPFPTMEVPWGYAYFLAAFYRVFGDRPWIPLLVQVAFNATTPMLLFAAARRWTDETTAALAALLLGAFSFNTVYASTQSSDAICTVLFLTSILVFMRAIEEDGRGWFALAGLIAGVMSQFRPNLILIPGVLAAYAVWTRPVRRYVLHGAVLLVCAGATLTPWVVRNYRLTKTIVPTSVHGGTQLWYGTLQSGPYLDSYGYNPRTIFGSPAFEYTSLNGVPILVGGGVSTCAIEERHGTLSLFYWTDLDPVKHRARLTLNAVTGRFTSEFPPPPEGDAAYYYYFEVAWPSDHGTIVVDTPAGGDRTPAVYFVSQDHLGDLDRHNDLLDIFDVIRLARREAWGEPAAAADLLARAGIVDVGTAVRTLLDKTTPAARLERDDQAAVITIGAGSTITIPRSWQGRLSDVTIAGPNAEALMYAHASLAALSRPAPAVTKDDARCGLVGEVTINDVFYRRQPQSMRRYSALALDNIRRDPFAFLKASLYRVYRVFVVAGSKDKWTNQQFAGAAAVYAAARAASLAFLGLFLAGVVILWRRRRPAILLPLLLILYVPVTIAPMLTNMRYSVTVQPLMFVFVAAALRSLVPRRTPASHTQPFIR
jgi:Dolichyl-phosphate-mannose-protein mannosyltransferase